MKTFYKNRASRNSARTFRKENNNKRNLDVIEKLLEPLSDPSLLLLPPSPSPLPPLDTPPEPPPFLTISLILV